MRVSTPSGRRDKRFVLQPGSSRVDFGHPRDGRRCRGELTMISVAGIAVLSDASAEGVDTGTIIPGVTVRVGDCALDGEIAIKNVTPMPNGRTQFGCLFYPATGDAQVKWMTLLAGMAAVQVQE